MPGHTTFGFNHDPNDMYTAWSLGTKHGFLYIFLTSHGPAFIGFLLAGSWDEAKKYGILEHFGFWLIMK
jgi:hypothetical protein